MRANPFILLLIITILQEFFNWTPVNQPEIELIGTRQAGARNVQRAIMVASTGPRASNFNKTRNGKRKEDVEERPSHPKGPQHMQSKPS